MAPQQLEVFQHSTQKTFVYNTALGEITVEISLEGSEIRICEHNVMNSHNMMDLFNQLEQVHDKTLNELDDLIRQNITPLFFGGKQ